MKTFQILAISGSLRSRSSNLSLLKAAQQLAPENFQISFYGGLSQLPHFNPDCDTETPPVAVADLRAWLRASDGVIICTPEYAHGLPGTLKNALDWTVSSGEWMEKPVLILNASPVSHFAHDSLVEILTTIMARTISHRIGLSGNKMDELAMLDNTEITSKLIESLGELETALVVPELVEI